MKTFAAHFSACALTALVACLALPASADELPRKYEVSITNLTRAQRFTPVLVVTHEETVRLFQLGTAASPELRKLAEEGDFGPLKLILETNPAVGEVVNTPPPPPADRLIAPGSTVRVEIEAPRGSNSLSLAAMLIPTNDAFLAINSVRLPKLNEVLELYAIAYDAGTERNDELCNSIPGPGFAECVTTINSSGNGGGATVGGGEGFVHVHNGMHGIGNFNAALRDWRNPVARVIIRRIR